MKLSGWGRYPVAEADLRAPRDVAALKAAIAEGPVIARGSGRAYGDSAIAAGATLQMGRMNRLLAFEPQTGCLTAEAGAVIGDVISAFLPRGWFPAVTPGTRFVTLGGMIAADVHGKNHHVDGSFGNFVDWIDVLGPDGAIRRCSQDEEPELFAHTLGGMGLTGVILRAAFRLRPVETGWICQRTLPAPDLAAAMAAFEENADAPYSVAWIDNLAGGARLGRSIVMLGRHAARAEVLTDRPPFPAPSKRRLSVPVDLPGLALNRLTVRAFNALYYWSQARKAGEGLVDWESYFYPLDAILGWNRIYGRKGFVQFQCALPLDRSEAGLRALLTATSEAGAGSFLAVLKRFGAEERRISFPMEGYTLALDFPANRRVFALLDRLDRIALDHGGRFYLAKDARMSAQTLRAADPRAEGFAALRDASGWRAAFRSLQSERLTL